MANPQRPGHWAVTILKAGLLLAATLVAGWSVSELQNRGEFATIPRPIVVGLLLVAIIVWVGTMLTSDVAKRQYWLVRAHSKKMLIVFLLIPALFGLVAYLAIYRKAPTKEEHDQAKLAAEKLPSSTEDIARLEFRAESLRALRNITVQVSLDREYSIQEVGHFRILFAFFDGISDKQPRFFLACQDAYLKNATAPPEIPPQFGVRYTAQYRTKKGKFSPLPLYQESGGPSYTTVIPVRDSTDIIEFGLDFYRQVPTYNTLDDLNRRGLAVYVTQALTDKIERVSLIVNNYVLTSIEASQLVVTRGDPPVKWFQVLSQADQKIPWRKVLIKPSADLLAKYPKMGNVLFEWNLDFDILRPQPRKDGTNGIKPVFP